jgi:hypothetical protein
MVRATFKGRDLRRATGGIHMPASQETTDLSYLAGYSAMRAPSPLPPHFGEIDVAAPFDPHRYFTMLRSTGCNPYLWRHDSNDERCINNNRVSYCEYMHQLDESHNRRFYEAMAWANAQDGDSTILKTYLKEIVSQKPDGNFIHYLGC